MTTTSLSEVETMPARQAGEGKVRSSVNARSLSLGLLGVIFVCTLAPYNDYVLNNTYLVGNYLPVGLLMVFLTFIALVNAPLWRWAPRHALGTAELSVSLGMMLVACAVPTSGLMRYLPSHLTGIPYQAGANRDYLKLLERLDLPEWMFPASAASSVAERANDPAIENYVGKAPVVHDTFMNHWRAVPWSAWARPAVAWGLLVAALYGAVLAMSLLVQRQWAENERLPFPLATLYVSLIDAPEAGHVFNRLFRSRAFQVAALSVFAIHGINGLNRYYPASCPHISLGFDLRAIMAEPPLAYAEWPMKVATLYFSMVGIAFFMQTKVAFSLWAFYLILNVAKMGYESRQATLSGAMSTDQLFGAVMTYGVACLWIGRRHWRHVLQQMFCQRHVSGSPERDPLSAFAGWVLVLCLVGVGAWLICAGASVCGAIVIVLLVMMFFLVVARVVAETGLIFVQVDSRLVRPWVLALNSLPASMATRTTPKSYFFTGLFYSLFTRDMRESLPVFATHAVCVADRASEHSESTVMSKARFMPAMGGALVIAYVVAGASTLYTEYTFSTTADRTQLSPINLEAIDDVVRSETLDGAVAYMPPRTGPIEMHSRVGHQAFGAGLTALLWGLCLRYEAWPLHPVGYLMAFSNPIQQIWFSVFVGWLLKIVIVRIGGTELFRSARIFAIGLIVGEAGAAAFWLLISICLNSLGHEYEAIRLLPG